MPETKATPPIVIGKFIKGACTVDDRIFEKFMNYYYTIIINNSTKIHRKKMNRYGRRRSMRLINKKTNYTLNRNIKRSNSFDSDSSNIDVKDFVISFSNLKKIRKYNLHKPKIELGKVEKRDNAKCMDSTADDVGYTFQQYMDSTADDVGYTFQQYMDSTVEMSEETHTFEQRQCQNEFETSSIHSLEILQDEPITPQAQSTPAQVQNIVPAYIHWNSDFNVNSDYMSSINLGLGLFTAIFPNNRQASIYGRLSFRSYDDLNACQRYFPTLLNTQSENESIYLTTSGAQMIPNNRSSTSADQEENFDEMESESQQLSNNHSLPSAVPEKNFPDSDEMETQQLIESPREENEERYPTINRTQLQNESIYLTTSGAQLIPNNRSSTSADQEENFDEMESESQQQPNNHSLPSAVPEKNFDEMESESQQQPNNHSLPSAVPEKNFPDSDEMETQQLIESPREENEERYPTIKRTQLQNESIYLTTSGAQLIPNNRSSTSADQEENFDEMESESQQLSNNHSLPSAVPEKNFPDYDEMETQQSIESPREENEERYPTINRTQLQNESIYLTTSGAQMIPNNRSSTSADQEENFDEMESESQQQPNNHSLPSAVPEKNFPDSDEMETQQLIESPREENEERYPTINRTQLQNESIYLTTSGAQLIPNNRSSTSADQEENFDEMESESQQLSNNHSLPSAVPEKNFPDYDEMETQQSIESPREENEERYPTIKRTQLQSQKFVPTITILSSSDEEDDEEMYEFSDITDSEADSLMDGNEEIQSEQPQRNPTPKLQIVRFEIDISSGEDYCRRTDQAEVSPFENPPQQQLLEIYDSYLLYLITIPEIRYMTPRIGAYLLKEFFKMKRKEPVRTLLKEFLELEPSQQAFFFKLMWLDMEQDYSFCYRRGNINIRSDLRDSVVLIIGDGFLLHNETCYHGEQAGIIFQSIPMQLLHSCRLKTYIVSIEEFDDRVALIRSDKVER